MLSLLVVTALSLALPEDTAIPEPSVEESHAPGRMGPVGSALVAGAGVAVPATIVALVGAVGGGVLAATMGLGVFAAYLAGGSVYLYSATTLGGGWSLLLGAFGVAWLIFPGAWVAAGVVFAGILGVLGTLAPVVGELCTMVFTRRRPSSSTFVVPALFAPAGALAGAVGLVAALAVATAMVGISVFNMGMLWPLMAGAFVVLGVGFMLPAAGVLATVPLQAFAAAGLASLDAFDD